MSAQDSFIDRHRWRQTRNGNFVRDIGPFKAFVFRLSGNRWGWSIRSNDALPEDSVFEAKQSAFAAMEAMPRSIGGEPRQSGRYRTIDPFVPAGVDPAEWLGGEPLT
jgi:hypothetical protein